MNNKTATKNQIVIKLQFPIIIESEKNEINILNVNKIKDAENINIFTSDIEAKAFVKPERKNKKNDKLDITDLDSIKPKLKSKKRQRSKFKSEEDYDPLNVVKNELLENDSPALPLERPEPPTKKTNFSLNKNINNKTVTKKNKKQNSLKIKELEKIPKDNPENISISGPLSVQELADLLDITETEIIRTLFLKGIGVTINQILDVNTALTIGKDLGINIEYIKELNDESKKIKLYETNVEFLEKRPPVVAVMGHVDHGKVRMI